MSEAQMDRQLGDQLRSLAGEHLEGWEFGPDLRQKVMARIAAGEADGVTGMDGASGSPGDRVIQPRHRLWRTWYAPAAAAAAVACFALWIGLGAGQKSMEQAGLESLPMAVESAPAESGAGAMGIAAHDPAPAAEPEPSAGGSANQGIAADSDTGVASAGAQPPAVDSEPASGKMAITGVEGEHPGQGQVFTLTAVQGAEPSLFLTAAGAGGETAYRAGDTVRIGVVLQAGERVAWEGPIRLSAWIPLESGERANLGELVLETGLPAGGGELRADFAWDQRLPGGNPAGAGEYTVHVRAEAAGGQTAEQQIILRLQR